MKYWLSSLPQEIAIERMVLEAKMRWRIERDYQDLKQDLGLGDYEGRGWRGFHHHASLAIAAYGFLMTRRLRHPSDAAKKNSALSEEPALPKHYKPRGSPARSAMALAGARLANEQRVGPFADELERMQLEARPRGTYGLNDQSISASVTFSSRRESL